MGKRNESGGGDPSSSHRRRSHRSDRRHTDDAANCGDRHRHRRHGSTDYTVTDPLDDRHHHRHRSPRHHRRSSAEGRNNDHDPTRTERVPRSHHRSRRERDARNDEYTNLDDGRLSRRRRRRRHGDEQRSRESSYSEDDMDGRGGRRENKKRWRETAEADDDDDCQQSRKRRPDSRQGDDEASRSVDWSSRRGCQRMPGLAYDIDQQKRFLGFLDRRDASGGREAAMEFTIGDDGLVQMPPPPTLVRRQNRNRHGATDSNDRRGTSSRHEQHRRHPPPSHTAPTANTHDEDGGDNSSVASHESLYNDPATTHMGILPDIIPPSNLYRVALYGVDLSMTASHLISMVAQLLDGGAKPWRVRRPAREMLHAAVSYNHTARQHPQYQPQSSKPPSSHKCNITSTSSVSAAVLADEPACTASSSGVLANPPSSSSKALHIVPTPSIGVLACESPVIGSGDGSFLPDSDTSNAACGVLGIEAESTSGILRNDVGDRQNHEKTEENDHGVLPDASSLPQPAAPALYLPGLHDVNGPGGMVVLEFTEQKHALRTTRMLNGAHINGRRVAASM